MGFTFLPIQWVNVNGKVEFTLDLTSALDRGGGQQHVPATLPPGKTRYPLYRRLDGPQGRSGRVRKTSPPPGFDTNSIFFWDEAAVS